MHLGSRAAQLARIAVALDDHDDARRRLVAARRLVERADAPPRLAEIEALAERVGGTSRTGETRPTANVFRREGEIFTIEYEGTVVPRKGLEGSPRSRAALAATRGARCTCSTSSATPAALPSGDVGEAIDARARAEYRQRLEDLDAEIAEAADDNDRGRLDRLQHERDFLVDRLRGRPRIRWSALAERATSALVGPARRSAPASASPSTPSAGRVAPQHSLATYKNSIRTGLFCSYQPEHPIAWAAVAGVTAFVWHCHMRCGASVSDGPVHCLRGASHDRDLHTNPDTWTTDLETQIGAYAAPLRDRLAALEAITIRLGRELGLYDLLADGAPSTPPDSPERPASTLATRGSGSSSRPSRADRRLADGPPTRRGPLRASARRRRSACATGEHGVDGAAVRLAPLGRRVLPALVAAIRSGGGVPYADYGSTMPRATSTDRRS